MNRFFYSVAGHCFCFQTSRENLIDLLLPSFRLFRDSGDKSPVFTLRLSDVPIDEQYVREVTTFEWELAECTVAKIEESDYLFRLSLKSGILSCTMVANSLFTEATTYFGDELDRRKVAFILNNWLMMLYAFAVSGQDTLLLHGSVVTCGGRGYLFLGRSGTGKSTHSRLWLSHIEGTKLLNDDNPVIRIVDEKILIYGTPWSGKTPCYRDEWVEVGAIVRLCQAPHNTIIQNQSVQAFVTLLPSCAHIPWAEIIFSGVCGTVIRLIASISIFTLECLPDRTAAELCYKTIVPCCNIIVK